MPADVPVGVGTVGGATADTLSGDFAGVATAGVATAGVVSAGAPSGDFAGVAPAGGVAAAGGATAAATAAPFCLANTSPTMLSGTSLFVPGGYCALIVAHIWPYVSLSIGSPSI